MLLRPTNWLRGAGHDLSEPREKIDRPFLIRLDSIARPATCSGSPVTELGETNQGDTPLMLSYKNSMPISVRSVVGMSKRSCFANTSYRFADPVASFFCGS